MLVIPTEDFSSSGGTCFRPSLRDSVYLSPPTVPQCGTRCAGRSWHNPSASGAKDDSPPFYRGPPTRTAVARVGVVERWVEWEKRSSPPGTAHESAEVVHPGEEPLHFPSSLVAPQLASVLRLSAPAPVGRDQLDAVRLFELLIESVRVAGFVSDELFGEFIEETSGEDLFDKLAFVGRSALDRYGERKTVISGDSDDLRPLAAPGWGRRQAPFFRAREGRIHERFFQVELALFPQMPRPQPKSPFELPRPHPLLEPAVAGLVRRILLRQLAPLRAGAQHPQPPVQYRSRVLPRATAVVRTPVRTQHRLDYFPLFFGQLPASCHRRMRRHTEHP